MKQMDSQMFAELLDSVREGGAILRGEISASRTFSVTPRAGDDASGEKLAEDLEKAEAG